ncbi:DNA polymerase zeta [Tulasnella sp. 403]|nr:DNA polymerase zeta [Tulasnella sp. 403]
MTEIGSHPTIKIRITNCDYALEPSGSLDNTSLHKVPVIRIYGLSSKGHKTCVHIHQVYPYFYLEYKGAMNPTAVKSYTTRLLRSLNHAIAISLRRNPDSRSRYIRSIHIIKGIPFYGFHCAYAPYLKVHVIDPQHTLRAATILRSGGVMQQHFLVFESHLSYLLQFMCDFGLYGCGELEVAEAYVRERTASEADTTHGQAIDTSMFQLSTYARQSSLPLELDVAAFHILNSRLLSARNIHHSLTIPAAPQPPEPLVLSVRELWEDERKRRDSKGLPPTPVMPSDGSGGRGEGPAWRAEARLRVELCNRIQRERETRSAFAEATRDWERYVMTAFESREVLWPSVHRKWKPEGEGESPFQTPDDAETVITELPQRVTHADETLDIDEGFLMSQQMQDLISKADGESALEDVEREAEYDEPAIPDPDSGSNGQSTTPTRRSPAVHTPSRQTSLRRTLTPSSLSRVHTGSSVSRNRQNPFSEQNWNASPSKESPTKRLSSESLIRKLSGLTADRSMSLQASEKEGLTTAWSNGFDQASVDSMGDPAWAPTMPAMETSHSSQAKSDDDSWAPTLPQTPPRSRPSLPLFGDITNPDEATLGQAAQQSSNSHMPPFRPTPSQAPTHQESKRPQPSSQDELRDFSNKRRKLLRSQSDGVGLGFGDIVWESSQSTGELPMEAQGKVLSQPETQRGHRPRSSTAFVYPIIAPSFQELLEDLTDHGIKQVAHRDPYYSNIKNEPKRAREFAGRLFMLKSGIGIGSLDEWKPADGVQFDGEYREGARRANSPSKLAREKNRLPLVGTGVTGWEYAGVGVSGPPSRKEILKWLEEVDGSLECSSRSKKASLQSQILGSTQKNKYGFKVTQSRQTEGSTRERQNMSVLSMELFAQSRGSLLPNPEHDAIECIFYAFQEDDVIITNPEERRQSYIMGCIAVESVHTRRERLRDESMELVETEIDLINVFVDHVRDWDPEVLTGWEVQNESWGYLADRAWKIYGLSISELVARIVHTAAKGGNTAYDREHSSAFRVAGRHVLNTWRVMRAEQALSHYTIENVAFHVLHRRIPHYSPETLTKWFRSDAPLNTARVLRYFGDRTAMVLEILDETQVVTKSAEFARVFGIEFFSVLSRGSQFKVESFMFRIAKPESLMLLSPSREEVGKQNAAECVPLIMEPKSAYYKSPLVVLDFQSLYPSIMIAYNYCYSTCLGRVSTFQGRNKFGVLDDLHLPDGLLEKVEDHITIAPNGIMYVKPSVRKSLLAKMLTELLDTRVMVKQAMKTSKDDKAGAALFVRKDWRLMEKKALMRVLDARQLSLKFICNVTYGYTSATFSGRMPAVEIADSIVQSGRETLEKAITTINTTAKWGAKVVYGDTDSLFISLEGKTKEEAFRIGHEMADTITAMNPRPVKLKFEKVYFPCVLLAKKRYVGFKYENPDDKNPVFDAKGIETVRRDGIPAGQKMVERCLKILFRSQDLSEVKSYCQSSWTKLMDGRVSLYDFIFSKEVKMGKYSDKGPPPPGVVVAARRLKRDPRAEAQYGDRIPYIITRGEPKSRLVDRAFDPLEVLKDRHQYQLDATYYIEHQLIPPLERVFNLVGANVASWYAEMPKVARPVMPGSLVPNKGETSGTSKPKFTIDEHFKSSLCIVCGKNTPQGNVADLLMRVESS